MTTDLTYSEALARSLLRAERDYALIRSHAEGTLRAALVIGVFRSLGKFHRENRCGRDGDHWPECDALLATLRDAMIWTAVDGAGE